MKPLLEAVRESTLVGDGAMGTQLQFGGLESGGCGEHWNLEYPDRVLRIQRAYVEAGSDCLITNTFGGTRIMLRRHGHADQVRDINRAGASIARQAFGDRPGYVLGDMGPFGGLMEPLGDITEVEVREAFEEQAAALVSAGVDAILVETQTSLEELGLAIASAKTAGAPCIIGSMAYDVTLDGSEVRTMMGVEVEQAAEFMAEAGADILALNCGTGIDMHWAARIVKRYRAVCTLPVMAQPNAGLPELINLQVHYRQTPDDFAAGVDDVWRAGAAIIGGCCGSTPAHIAKLRRRIDELTARTSGAAS
jgi:5-methyltetrahydrofolate--homocysteine methyltransferase